MRDNIVTEAKSWLGTPYCHSAQVKQAGVDCGQLLIAVYTAVGILKPGECQPGYYPHDWHLHRSEEKYLYWVQQYCNATDSPLPGDIAVFQFGRCTSHAGIVIQWPQIIHSYVGLGVILSDVNEAILQTPDGNSRLRGIYRIKGVAT